MTTAINIHLHDAQKEILETSARFKIVACGRRFGKTTLDIAEVLLFAANNPGAIIWWVTPTYELGEEARKTLEDAIPPHLRTTNLQRRIVTLWNGVRIFYRSADRPDNLRAVGIDLLIIDEGAFIKAERWHRELRPTLADSLAPAILTSTFNGENWFYDLFMLGLDPAYPQYASFRYPTSANPFIAPEEIEEARRTTPKAEFEQEWEANPLIYIGAIFDGGELQAAAERGARAAQTAKLRTPVEAAAWTRYAGLDWGFDHPTVFLVNEEHSASSELRWLTERIWRHAPLGPDRTGQRTTRVDTIVELCRNYRIARIYADAAGADQNDALYGAILDAGIPTELIAVPFGAPKMSGSRKRIRTGVSNKAHGIVTRRWYLERNLESIMPECPELLRTSKKYRNKEGADLDPVKEDDDPVDAATAFYASRRGVLAGEN